MSQASSAAKLAKAAERFIFAALYVSSLSGSPCRTAPPMKLRAQHFLLLAIALTLGACHFTSPKAPTGQVVATVGEREITRRQLQLELNGAGQVTPAGQKAQQQAALQYIIQRSILADAAKQQGVNKDPNFILLSERANDALLVQMLQAKIAASVPPPTREEANSFEEANPNVFAERKIFEVEQMRMARPADSSILAKLKPLNTLDDIASFLTQNHIAFQRGQSTIDAVGQNPKLVSAIVALPPNEVFIISSGNGLLINQVLNTRTQPFTGEPATKYALHVLQTQHAQEAVQRAFASILGRAQTDVRINKDFQPTPKPVSVPSPPIKASGD